MPDTCLDTTPSQSLDVRLLKVAEWAAKKSVDEHSRGMLATSRITQQRADELVALACLVRTQTHRPGRDAHALIECLRVATDLDDAIAASATTLRTMPTDDLVRVLAEIEVQRARRAVGQRGEWAR